MKYISNILTQGTYTSDLSSLLHPNTNLHSYVNHECTSVIKNQQNMQVKVAIFNVIRNEKNEIVSSSFNKEFWVEKAPGVPIELLAAKELGPNFDPNGIVVKELNTVYL
mgnify:CR=1 FL=1